MDCKKSIYEDKYYKIYYHEKFSNVPGMVVIKPKLEEWYYNDKAIEKLAILEKAIRDCLFEVGVELVGIYKEQDENGKYEITMIPYHIYKLNSLGISPDLYQPFIEKYLNSFDSSDVNELNSINKKITLKLRTVGE